MRRLLVAAVAVAAVFGSTATAAAAPPPPPPEVVDVSLQADAPGGQLWLVARGFTARTAANVELLSGATDDVIAQLPPIVTNAYGVVLNPAGYRMPGEVTAGSYTLRVSQPGGASATWDEPLTVAAPAVRVYGTQVPGVSPELFLTGFGGGADIARTVSVDDRPLPLSAVTEAPHTDSWGDVSATTTLPTDLTVGSHTLSYTQSSSPAATVHTTFTIVSPQLGFVDRGWYPSLGNRQRISLRHWDFGPGAVTLAMTDSAGRTTPLPAPDDAGTSTFTLPDLPVGDVVFTAVRPANGARATVTGKVSPSRLTSPAVADFRDRSVAAMSPSGTVFLQQNGRQLRLQRGAETLWTTDVFTYQPMNISRLAVQTDGNLVAYSGSTAVWSSQTKTTDGPVTLSVLEEGRAVLTTAHGAVLWTTPTTALTTLPAGGSLATGSRLYNDRYSFVVQGDGNVVLYRGSTALWATRTAGNPGAVLKIQSDGNLVLYATNGRALWANHVKSATGSRLVLQADGNLVEYTASGKPLWASGTAGR